MADSTRIELTLRLWSTGAVDAFEEYIGHLTGLLPRHRGTLERRVGEVEAGPGAADALLVVSFPDAPAVDGFLRDPLRADAEDLAGRAISRSLITDGRHRVVPNREEAEAADVVDLRRDE